MKNRKSNLLNCSSAYYDYYSFPFPVKALDPVKRNKFLCSQLEKLHPCFSDDCCFDSRIKLAKNGLKADVVVMQKFRLAEYKQQNRQKAVYIEELKRIPFFTGSRNYKRISAVAGIFLLLLIAIFACLKMKNKTVSNVANADPDISESLNDITDTNAEQNPFVSINELLDAIYLNKGKTTGFFWTVNGFSQKLLLSLKNLYPEMINQKCPGLSVSSVVYEKNIPSMSVQINSAIKASSVLPETTEVNNGLLPELRNFLLQKNMIIIEETLKPYGIKIQLENNPALFKSLFDYLAHNKLSFSSLSINPQKDNMLVSITFAPVVYKNQNEFCLKLIESAEIFFVKEKSGDTELQKIKVQNEKSKQKKESELKGSSVGKIIRTDGSIIEFYKDENGRIKQR